MCCDALLKTEVWILMVELIVGVGSILPTFNIKNDINAHVTVANLGWINNNGQVF